MLKKNILKQLLSIATLIICFTLTSCGDDDDVIEIAKDIENPKVTINGLTQGAEVWNQLKLSVTATDNEDIDKVEIFINGTLLKSLTSAPYETEWDTHTVNDGEHVIKVTAYDKNGNTSSAQITVVVKNTLLQITVGANVLYANERRFILLSDASGNTLAYREVKNGDNVVIKGEDYNGATFYLTEASLINSYGQDRARVMTFADVSRGKWSIESPTVKLPMSGTATLQFSSATLLEGISIVTNENSDYISPGLHAFEMQVELRRSPSSVYIFNETQGVYRVFTDVKAGESLAVNMQEVSLPLARITQSNQPGLISINYRLHAFSSPTSFDDIYDLGSRTFYMPEANEAFLVYPGNGFPRYFARVTYTFEDKLLYSQRLTPSLQIARPSYAFHYVYEGNRFKYDLTGDDVDFMAYMTYNDHSEWVMYLPKGSNRQVLMLTLPDELAKPFAVLYGTQVRVFDAKQMNGYHDLVEKVRSSPIGGGLLNAPELEYTYEEVTIGMYGG